MAVEYNPKKTNQQPSSMDRRFPAIRASTTSPPGTMGRTRFSDPLPSVAISSVEHGHLRFLIHDGPTDANLRHYLERYKQHGVTDVVRVCEPTYSAQALEREGISVHDWKFDDGGVPPQTLISKWLTLVQDRCTDKGACIAIHCVAGLGRAPALVAIALIESGMAPLDAIEFIRRRRRGAFNSRQIQFLDSYKRRKQPKNKNKGSSTSLKQKLNKIFRLRKVDVEVDA